jgi:hypothetical protein
MTFTARATDSTTGEPRSGTVVIQIASDEQSAQWDVNEDFEAELTIYDSNTEGLTKANDQLQLDYDIEAEQVDGTFYTVEIGTLIIEADVTQDSGTAAYLSWKTRNAYRTELAGITACLDITYLSTAASASDTDIDVDNGALFSATDDICIYLDDGTVQEVTIDTVATNNLDFSTSDPGGLTDDAAIDNVVMKVIGP